MRSAKYFLKLVAGALFLYLAVFPISSLMAAEEAPSLPKFSLNGKPVTLTVQDLSGFGTRPLRLLVQRNNRAHHEELIQVYALGVSEGDDLKIQLATPLAGIRATVYKILHAPDGERFLSMPASVYFEKPGQTDYAEKIGPFHEAFFIIAFEKTDSADEKDVNVRYFEERVRKLTIGSYKTNFLFSSLKIKMKDFADPDAKEFFERDAQVLVGRLIDPRRVFLIRLWKIPKPV